MMRPLGSTPKMTLPPRWFSIAQIVRAASRRSPVVRLNSTVSDSPLRTQDSISVTVIILIPSRLISAIGPLPTTQPQKHISYNDVSTLQIVAFDFSVSAFQSFSFFHRLADDPAHSLHGLFADFLAGGEDDHPCGDAFGFGEEESGVGLEGAVGFHAVAAGPEVFPGDDVLRVEDCHDFVTVARAHVRLHFDDDILEVVFLRWVVTDEADAGEPGQAGDIGFVVPAVHADDVVHGFERGESHGGAGFVHFSVDPEVIHPIEILESKVAHKSHLLGEGIVIGHDCAALEAVDELGGVETEDLAGAGSADHPSVFGASEPVRGVIHDLEVVSCSDLLDGIRVASSSPHMNADDSSSLGGDQALDFLWINVVPGRIHIAENRGDLLPLKRMGCGDECVRRDDDLSMEIQSAGSDLQGDGRIAKGDAVLDAEKLRDASLEFLDEWAVIREPTSVEHLVDAAEKSLAIADVRAADVKFFVFFTHCCINNVAFDRIIN